MIKMDGIVNFTGWGIEAMSMLLNKCLSSGFMQKKMNCLEHKPVPYFYFVSTDLVVLLRHGLFKNGRLIKAILNRVEEQTGATVAVTARAVTGSNAGSLKYP